MLEIDEILAQLARHSAEDRCQVDIEKWSLLAAEDATSRLDCDEVRTRLELVATQHKHLNLAAHYEQRGFTIVYGGRLAALIRLLDTYPNEIRTLCELRRS